MEIFYKTQIKKTFRTKSKNHLQSKKIWSGSFFGFVKSILSFTRMSVREINKAKRELEFVLMALNIRKVTVQRAKNNQKNYKKTISIFFQ
ncbi:hypothetical protein HMPREF9976_04145 [Staphylococcus epidermidis NIHLM003]|nr:hypothetical protein HMPREF9992_04252 [Staphylococcus epidermidis NIHLM070]EJE23577.1 hypothetical protein HMPREF9976_04145 [Staphylococcus epidermidis NIHLM003]OFN06234.1 transposase [Staphylococcus sp. HMSC064E11]OFR14674.1 transposase [Staphylococcus sp. HMSC068G12]OHQ96167.1 transposase [Staphylococcus sp. HMSC077C03]OHR10301.1 transposase [Staphylococcus sp. HMSC077H01]